jgi:hypothetical protein
MRQGRQLSTYSIVIPDQVGDDKIELEAEGKFQIDVYVKWRFNRMIKSWESQYVRHRRNH